MKVQLARMHWGRVIGTSILIVLLAPALNLLVVLFAFHIWDRPEQEQIVSQVVFWSPSILTILLTGLCAIWVARKVERKAPLHSLLMGLVVALAFLLFEPNVTNFFRGAYRGRLDLLVVTLLTFVLTIAAGWLGGVVGSRRG
jgi:hypothetical protein